MVTPELALEWAPPNDPRLPAMLGVLRDDAQQVGDLAVSILDVLFRHWDDIDADSDDHDSIHAAKDADLSWAGFGVLFVSLECMLRFSIEAVVERFAVSRVATKRIVHYVGGRGLPPADAVRSGIRLRDHFVTHIYHLVCALANSAPGAALLLTHHILSAALLAPTATPVALLLRLSQHSYPPRYPRSFPFSTPSSARARNVSDCSTTKCFHCFSKKPKFAAHQKRLTPFCTLQWWSTIQVKCSSSLALRS
eukprot:GEMP01049202.1.p1 GENE.GEMP01049202.1~~GEMP01049202.1.p1  ORF type:complete len:251 (+),score=71.96 GEMP01049202.1:102-854(+)